MRVPFLQFLLYRVDDFGTFMTPLRFNEKFFWGIAVKSFDDKIWIQSF